jgi:ATP-dependent DNA helicase RecG
MWLSTHDHVSGALVLATDIGSWAAHREAELKRSTAELKRAGETLCAFLNGGGGRAVIGVGPDGRLVGQEVADITLRSVRRNPLIAEAFHRTGAIEAWGRGTNRVIEACRAYGIPDPEFVDGAGAVTVTFRAEVVAGTRDLVPDRHQVGTKSALSAYQVQVLELADVPRAVAELMVPSGRTDRTKFRDQVVAPLLEAGLLEMTIPDQPRSSKQQYRTKDAGRAALATTRKAWG